MLMTDRSLQKRWRRLKSGPVGSLVSATGLPRPSSFGRNSGNSGFSSSHSVSLRSLVTFMAKKLTQRIES